MREFEPRVKETVLGLHIERVDSVVVQLMQETQDFDKMVFVSSYTLSDISVHGVFAGLLARQRG